MAAAMLTDIFDDAAGDVWVTGEGYHGVLLLEAGGYKWLPMPLLHSGISRNLLDVSRIRMEPRGRPERTSFCIAGSGQLPGDPDRDFGVMTRRFRSSAKRKTGMAAPGPSHCDETSVAGERAAV